MKQLAVSYVIPAYNEEESLPRVLSAIKKHTPSAVAYEVIVVDNGSQDETVRLAKESGAKVLVDETSTVGGLRNLGVKSACGSVLVFLDADVLITKAWSKNIESTLQSLNSNPWQVTGSRCGLSETTGWIERYWFKPLVSNSSNYINSGHLITSSELFNKIGGFDNRLVSGEDYAFSQAAVSVNATILNNPALAVVHEGYPSTLLQFMRREVWHGKGDCESFSSLVASKVALASIFFIALHVAAVAGYLFSLDKSLIVFFVASIAGLCVASAVYKSNARNVASLVAVSFLYYCYYLSRFLSCLSHILDSGKHVKRHR